jgi:hypothetical protein
MKLVRLDTWSARHVGQCEDIQPSVKEVWIVRYLDRHRRHIYHYMVLLLLRPWTCIFFSFVNNQPSNTAICFKSHNDCYMFEFNLKYLRAFYSDTDRNSYKPNGGRNYVWQYAMATEFSRWRLVFMVTPHGACLVSPSCCLEFSGSSYILGKFLHPWYKLCALFDYKTWDHTFRMLLLLLLLLLLFLTAIELSLGTAVIKTVQTKQIRIKYKNETIEKHRTNNTK